MSLAQFDGAAGKEGRPSPLLCLDRPPIHPLLLDAAHGGNTERLSADEWQALALNGPFYSFDPDAPQRIRMSPEEYLHNAILMGAVSYANAFTSTTVDGSVPEVWTTKLEAYLTGAEFFARWAEIKSELMTNRGDVIHIDTEDELTATGDLVETTVLEGNEEVPNARTQVTFRPLERGNAVRKTVQSMAKSIHDERGAAINQLGKWASKKIDRDLRLAATNIPNTQVRYGGGRTTRALLTAADTLTPNDISICAAYMRSQDVPMFGAAVDGPVPANPRTANYVMIANPYQMYDLCRHAEYLAVANNAALVAAAKDIGPNFQGFAGWWDGVEIFQTSQIPYAAENYSVAAAKAPIFGPRGYARAVGLFGLGSMIWKEKEFDYGRAHGFSLRWFDHCQTLNANRCYAIWTAATNLAGVMGT